MQAVTTNSVVFSAPPLWNMRRVGRKSAVNSPMQRARAAASLTQEAVAERLEVTPTTVQRWEGGSREPDHAALCKLADLYGVSVDELLGREPLPERNATLPIPDAEQLAVVIRRFGQIFFPEIGPLDENSLLLCAQAWRGFLASYAADPSRFAEDGRIEFAADLLSDRFGNQQRLAPGR